MTLEVEVPRVSYVADGATETFATGFTFELATEVTVWRGEPTVEDCCSVPEYDNLYALNVDYTIDEGDWLVDGGTIRFAAHAIPAADQLVTLMRTTPPDQPEGFGDQDEFQPEQHERTLDRLTRMVQELYHNPLGFLLLGGLAYEHRFYAPDEWDDTTPIDVHNYARGVTYPAGLAGSVFSVEAYDTVPYVVSVEDADGDPLGTITIPANSGAVTKTTTGGAGFSLGYGGQMRLIPPEGGLGTVRGFAGTIVGAVAAS